MSKNTNYQAMTDYLIDHFDFDYAVECDLIADDNEWTVAELCDAIIQEGRRVYDYPANVHNIPREDERMADYFMGLPSPFHPEYRYFEIEELLREWGIIKVDDKPAKIEKLKKNWFVFWANFIMNRRTK